MRVAIRQISVSSALAKLDLETSIHCDAGRLRTLCTGSPQLVTLKWVSYDKVHPPAMLPQIIVPDHWQRHAFSNVARLPKWKQLHFFLLCLPLKHPVFPLSTMSFLNQCFSSPVSSTSLSQSSSFTLYLLTVPASLLLSAS